jgi:hypothetical protein
MKETFTIRTRFFGATSEGQYQNVTFDTATKAIAFYHSEDETLSDLQKTYHREVRFITNRNGSTTQSKMIFSDDEQERLLL